MTLNAPTTIVFLITLVIAIIALLAVLNVVTVLPIAAVWLMTGAYILLALACIIPGL